MTSFFEQVYRLEILTDNRFIDIIDRYTNFHRYFGVLVYSTVCTKFVDLVKASVRIFLKFVQQNFSLLIILTSCFALFA